MRLLGALFLGIVIMLEIVGGLFGLANSRSVLNEIEGILAIGFGTLTLTVAIVGVRLGKLIEGLPAAIQARPADAPRSEPIEPPRPTAGPGGDYVNPKYATTVTGADGVARTRRTSDAFIRKGKKMRRTAAAQVKSRGLVRERSIEPTFHDTVMV